MLFCRWMLIIFCYIVNSVTFRTFSELEKKSLDGEKCPQTFLQVIQQTLVERRKLINFVAQTSVLFHYFVCVVVDNRVVVVVVESVDEKVACSLQFRAISERIDPPVPMGVVGTDFPNGQNEFMLL